MWASAFHSNSSYFLSLSMGFILTKSMSPSMAVTTLSLHSCPRMRSITYCLNARAFSDVYGVILYVFSHTSIAICSAISVACCTNADFSFIFLHSTTVSYGVKYTLYGSGAKPSVHTTHRHLGMPMVGYRTVSATNGCLTPG